MVAAVALLLVLLAVPAAAPPPELSIQAPAELEEVARRLRRLDPGIFDDAMGLLGLTEAGPPIQVVLAPEDSAAARRTPSWISGYAYPSLGTIVLLPARSPSYPDSSLEELLRHEVNHVLTARATAGRPLPRWLDEGLAMIAGGRWSLEDRSRVTLAVIRRPRASLRELERLFAGNRGEMASAYALSESFARYLIQRFGVSVVPSLLSGVARGLPFRQAFRRATGLDLTAVEGEFWERESLWHRWLPLLTSSTALWLAIVLLATLAARRRRARAALLEEAWESEEQLRRLRDLDEVGAGGGVERIH